MFLGKVPFGGFLWERSFMGRSFMEVLPSFFSGVQVHFFFWSLIENESILKFTQVRFSIIINEVGSEESRLGILKVLICISFQA